MPDATDLSSDPSSCHSRELVAKTIIAVTGRAETEGMSIDVMDGDGSIEGELEKVVTQGLDSWIG